MTYTEIIQCSFVTAVTISYFINFLIVRQLIKSRHKHEIEIRLLKEDSKEMRLLKEDLKFLKKSLNFDSQRSENDGTFHLWNSENDRRIKILELQIESLVRKRDDTKL